MFKIYFQKWKITLSLFFLLAINVSPISLANTINQPVKSPYAIRYPTEVNQLLNQINPQNMWNNLTQLTQFPDRYSNHQTGLNAENWLKTQLQNMIQNSGRQDASIFTVNTAGNDPWGPFQKKQSSIVIKLGSSNQPGIVLGAHFDTLACSYTDETGPHDDDGCLRDPYGPLPGANDDGSGTVTILELTRILLDSHMQFKNPIYLILYAAEEAGELGSISVVNYFKKNNIPVQAVMQLDQTGFSYQNDPTMWIETNKNRSSKVVDDDLSNYLVTLIQTYIKKPVTLSCSGSSDEETWFANGIAASRPLEADYCDYSHIYQYMHSKYDTMEKLSLTHMTDYLKLAAAFAVELAEPKQ